jgi:protein-L-isoaspartate O-methyltransferase
VCTHGLHAPFDRIIATCPVPTVPWAWAEQLREGGLVLVDLEPGNLVLLTRHADRLEGPFLGRGGPVRNRNRLGLTVTPDGEHHVWNMN